VVIGARRSTAQHRGTDRGRDREIARTASGSSGSNLQRLQVRRPWVSSTRSPGSREH
jgi:hypothetical protein